MSGKAHATVGFLVVSIVSAGLMTWMFGDVNVLILTELCIGAIMGSLMPDIDSSRSKASQKFTRAVFMLIWAIAIGSMAQNYMNVSFINEFLGRAMTYIKGDLWLMLFMGIVTLGKFSPHRQFTHKWFGTILACFTAFMAFHKWFAIGFVAGYILHILGDVITPAGRKDPWFFFDFKFPMQNSKGEFHYHF